MMARDQARPLYQHPLGTSPVPLGWLPATSVLAGLGLLSVAFANTLGLADSPFADIAFWAGIFAIIGPGAWRLFDRAPDRRERIGILAVMAIALYIVKLLHSPTSFTLYDEMQHLRTAQDIALTGHLFAENPLLLVSPRYPGLEVATDVIGTATGTSTFQAGLVVVGAARLLLALAMFLFFELVTRNDRVAGIATFVYMANPNFLFFDAQFGYESIAVGFLAVVMYLIALSDGRWSSGAAAAVIPIAGVIVTHHISTYALIAFLVTWSFVWWLAPSRSLSGPGPLRLTVITIVGATAWLFAVAPLTISYLGGRFADMLALISLLLGDIESRELFRATGGMIAPEWERIFAWGSVFLILGLLPIGLWRLWRELRHDPTAITLGLVAMVYPVTLALRLTQQGAEEAARSSGFIFFGVALVVALAVTAPVPAALRLRAIARPALVTIVVVMFMGGAIVGVPRWVRIPGPYLAGADTRSVERQGIQTATWMLEHLGPERRVVADRVNRILTGLFGRQRPVSNFADQVRTYELFFGPDVGDKERSIIERGDVEYIVVDRRLAGVRPLAGPYFESGEDRRVAQAGGLTLEALTKFEDVPGVDVIFDSEDMSIYDVRDIATGVRP